MEYDLVFEGGGAKGLVFVGAMQAFENANHTYRRLIGTSAGAITAVLLAAGYESAELLAATNEKTADGQPRFATFMDVPESFDDKTIDESLTWSILQSVDNPLLPKKVEDKADRRLLEGLLNIPIYRNLFSFIERGGWYDGRMFRQWLVEKLNGNGRKLGNTNLAQFHRRRPDTELTVIAADTFGSNQLILNHRTAPNLPVVWAVRMSMSIPFLWQEVIWQERWGRYRGQDITGHTIVDGGVLSNFAMDLLVSEDSSVRKMMGRLQPERGILGFLIDESLPVPGSGEAVGAAETADEPDSPQQQAINRITRLVDTITNGRDKTIISEYQDFVCRLPAQGYGTTEFGMSEKRMEAIIAAGRKTMSAFLQ